eukprot:5562638-Pleurochrysis_carterae.AAC.1
MYRPNAATYLRGGHASQVSRERECGRRSLVVSNGGVVQRVDQRGDGDGGTGGEDAVVVHVRGRAQLAHAAHIDEHRVALTKQSQG